MEEQQTAKKPKRSAGRVFLRILKKVLLWTFLLIVVLFLLILTPPVQQFITNKATSYLEEKLGTRVEIKRLFFTLNGNIAVDGLYLEDQKGDTLLAADRLRVGMSLYKIIFKGDVDIRSVLLEGVTASVVRPHADSGFNYQYIIDAFDPGPSADTSTSSSGSSGFRLGKIEISQLRARYADAQSGDDYRVAWVNFGTDLSGMNLDNGRYDIGRTMLRGLQATIIRSTPGIQIQPEPTDTAVVLNNNTAENPMLVLLSQLNLEDAKVVFSDSTTSNFIVYETDVLRLRGIDLDITGGTYRLAGLAMRDARFRYDNALEPKQPGGIDFAHINSSIPELETGSFYMKGDSLSGNIAALALKEQSGFSLNQLTTRFSYSSRQASLTGLRLRTNASSISRDLLVTYSSIDDFSNNLDAVYANIDLRDTRIGVRDILYFVPDLKEQPLFSNARAEWRLDAQLAGTVNDILISQFDLNGPQDLRVSLKGRLRGAMNPAQLVADLNINEVYVTRHAVESLVPADQLPPSLQVPGWVNASGKLKGNAKELNMDMVVKTDKGEIDLKGLAGGLADTRQMNYDLELNIHQLDLGYLLKDTAMYGPLTASFFTKGKGVEWPALEAELSGKVESMRLNGYTYLGLPISAGLKNQELNFATGLKDPNLHFALDGSMNLQPEYPALELSMMIDSAKLQELGFASEPMIIRTGIEASFTNVDPDNLDGELMLQQLLLVKENERLQLDTVRLAAGGAGSSRFLNLQSEIAELRLNGQYQLTRLGDVLMNAVEPYYQLGMAKPVEDDYDFTLQARLTDRPLLRSLVPGLEEAKGVQLDSRFSKTGGVEAELNADILNYGGNKVNGLLFTAVTSDSALNMNVRLASLESGGMQLDSTILKASLADNKINWDATIKNKQARDRYQLGGILQQDVSGDIVLQMDPGGLLLNYERWNMADSNQLRIGSNGIWARDFELRNGAEVLRLHSQGVDGSSPLHVSLKDFHVSTLSALVMSDSSMLEGTLNGEIDLRNLNTTPIFAGDLEWKNMSYNKDTVGNLTARFNNAGQGDRITAGIELNGRGNDVHIDGTYDAAASTLDLRMNLEKLPMQTVEAFAGGSIRHTKGYLDGPFRITGPVSAPVIDGELRFHNAGLNVAMLNSYFTIDNEKLQFTREGLRLNQFQVKDSLGNELSLNGRIDTRNYINYNYDVDIRARNFQALNSTKRDNPLFWGQLNFTTNLKLQGTEAKPVIDGRLTINEKTKMTVVLPQSEPGVVERAGVIEFVDMDAPLNDSLFLAAYDSLNVTGITGMDVSLNVTIDKAADFTLVIDEGNGDFLNVRGEAQLNTGIDPSGKITMVGTYELEQGSYELSFNMLRKKFDIQKGSRIIWEGEPTAANVDIRAKYVANTAPLDLVKGQLDENITAQERNTYLQRLPFEVNLRMQGELMRPQITFDIILPENRSYGVSNDILTNVRTKLEQLRQSAGDMNKQVFSLLLLNRFVAENPFASSAAPTSASTMLRQSVSKLLTEQLNRLAEGLIEGVDINFGIESSDDYTTGERQERTDLNVGLSKRLLNDRLTVTVGSNFALEGPQQGDQQANNIAGNVAIDYALSSDGRYKLRAYRKNDYQGVIDGYVVETGVSFIITVDYNQFRQIFQKRRRRLQPSPNPSQREGNLEQRSASSSNTVPIEGQKNDD